MTRLSTRSLRRSLASATFLSLATATLLAAWPARLLAAEPPPNGPVAERVPKDVSIHGDTRIDDYFWLRERDNPKVLQHLQAEAAHTERWFEPLKPLSERLFAEMLGRIQQSDEAVPVREGAWWYSSRTETGQQYPVLIRRPAQGPKRLLDVQAPQQVLLDLNEMAKGQAFLSVGAAIPSPDGRLLAYTVDYTGSRLYELRIRDLSTGQDLPWRGRSVSSFAWSADSRHLFHVGQNEALRSDRLWRHEVGTSGGDSLVHEESDPLFNISVATSDDQRHLVLSIVAKDTTEQRLLRSATPRGSWRVVIPRQRGLEYEAYPHEGSLILRINDKGPNYRLLRVPMAAGTDALVPSLDPAAELVGHRLTASLDGVRIFRRHLVLQVREGGSVRLRVMDHARRQWRAINFPEPAYVAQVINSWQPRSLNLEYDSDTVRILYTSMVTPVSTYEARLDGPGLTLLKRQAVLGGYDPAKLEALRLNARASDGTEVPISLVRQRSATPGRPAPRTTGTKSPSPSAAHAGKPGPLLLIGYGSYGIPSDPRFSSGLLSLVERGVTVAIAHIRGGGDLGRHWYQQGKLDRKMNTFTDFIAVADHLVAQGYTTPQQLIINGGSAGGLLMGAVTNLRPELFKAVVTEVPFVDVINTMLDESLPLTTEEFIEWGNPKVAAEYAWMRAYSPYDNLRPGPYPAILARTAFHDSQVPYWEAAKYVARLRTLKTDRQALLLDINMNAGHGGASGRFDALKERARVYAFMLSQWGLVEPPR